MGGAATSLRIVWISRPGGFYRTDSSKFSQGRRDAGAYGSETSQIEPPNESPQLADFYVAFGTSLETLYGPCSGKAKFRRDQLEPQLRGILGEGMEAPLSLLLFVEFSPSIYIFHAVPQHVVHQTG